MLEFITRIILLGGIVLESEKRKKFIINFIYVTIILFLIFMVIKYGLGLITPFILAFLIAYIIKRPARFISKKIKIPYKFVAFLLVLIFYSTVGLLISIVGIKLVSKVLELIYSLPSLYYLKIEPFLVLTFDNIEEIVLHMDPALVSTLNDIFTQVTKTLGQLISNISMKAVSFISGYASSLPGLFIKILLMIISTFFIAIDYDVLTGFVYRQFSTKMKNLIISIKEYVVGTLFVCIRSYALIMCITFIELSIGLSILKIENSILIAFVISIFDILPVLGTGGVMIPWTIITAIQRNVPLAISLLIVYIVITIIRNIIEPKIVGSQLGLHPVVTLISMFVGAQLFGVIGLFGFPITLSLLHHLNDTGAVKLFK